MINDVPAGSHLVVRMKEGEVEKRAEIYGKGIFNLVSKR